MLYHVEILKSLIDNQTTGWRFLTDRERLGDAIAAVTDVPRSVACWVLPVPEDRATTFDGPRLDEELLQRIRTDLSGPFMELAKTSPEDPTGRVHARGFAELLISRVGGEAREQPDGLAVYLPGADSPEVVLLYHSASGLN